MPDASCAGGKDANQGSKGEGGKGFARRVILSESEGAQATDDESKDPDDVSLIMQIRGVLFENAGTARSSDANRPREQNFKIPPTIAKENSLHRHGKGGFVGILRLALQPALAGSCSLRMTVAGGMQALKRLSDFGALRLSPRI